MLKNFHSHHQLHQMKINNKHEQKRRNFLMDKFYKIFSFISINVPVVVCASYGCHLIASEFGCPSGQAAPDGQDLLG